MDVDINNSETQEAFITTLIAAYKKYPVLWQKNHPKYKSRSDRKTALDCILTETKRCLPEANMEFIKSKLENIKASFRREHKKVEESKTPTKEGHYIPQLWYYTNLLFLVGEASVPQLETSKHNISPWSKHSTIILIDLLKSHPILYSLEPPGLAAKGKRLKEYKKITEELIEKVGNKFEVYEVKNKINTLKQQFKRVEEQYKGPKKGAKLWCYELLSFLKNEESASEEFTTDTIEVCKNEPCSPQEDMGNFQVTDCSNGDQIEEEDDLFDTIGKNVALKLREMSDTQRAYAESLINEVTYLGLMERLNPDSRLTND